VEAGIARRHFQVCDSRKKKGANSNASKSVSGSLDHASDIWWRSFDQLGRLEHVEEHEHARSGRYRHPIPSLGVVPGRDD
jgi:hypothetical protein